MYVLYRCGALSFGNWCQMIWDWDMLVVPNHQALITLWPCPTSHQNNILNSTALKASETHSSDIVPLCLEFPLVCYCMVVLLVYLVSQAVKAADRVVDINRYPTISVCWGCRRWCTYTVYLIFLRKFTVSACCDRSRAEVDFVTGRWQALCVFYLKQFVVEFSAIAGGALPELISHYEICKKLA